jgi:hypothetical protein
VSRWHAEIRLDKSLDSFVDLEAEKVDEPVLLYEPFPF